MTDLILLAINALPDVSCFTVHNHRGRQHVSIQVTSDEAVDDAAIRLMAVGDRTAMIERPEAMRTAAITQPGYVTWRRAVLMIDDTVETVEISVYGPMVRDMLGDEEAVA